MSKLWTPFDLAVVLLRWSAIEILAIKSKIAIITRCVLILFILTTVSVRFNNYFRYFIVVPSSIKCYILWSEVFVYIERLQTLNKSASSLWLGPRQCGKSTLIRHMLSNEKYFEIDLLKSEYFRRYLSSPEQFRKDVEFQINKKEMKYFFIDEIQKIPELTNEIHFSKHSKFYMCDNGITNSILRNLKDNLRPEVRGKMFEQWLINEIRNFSIYAQSDYEFHFWRTERGEFEVDLILSKKSKPLYAIEIKAKKKIVKKDLTSLLEFQKENSLSTLILLYEGEQAYSEGDILILPYYEIWDELVAKKKRAL